MSQKLINVRVALAALLVDVQAIGRSRELSLAVTSIQAGRMLLGKVCGLLGSPNPYKESMNPASPVVEKPADVEGDVEHCPFDGQISSVKWVRAVLEDQIQELIAFRRNQWARCYGTVEELLFDAALVDLVQAKNWLGEQLAVIAGHALVKAPAREPLGCKAPEVSPQKGAEGAKTEGVAVDDGKPEATGTEVPAGGPGDEEPPTEDQVDGWIIGCLASGRPITEICRQLDVTEYRVNKIRETRGDAIEAEKAKIAAKAADAATPATE